MTVGGAAAALTGLLFVAVSLRPREIREGPLTIGRARSAFYAFATVVFVALLSLAGDACACRRSRPRRHPRRGLPDVAPVHPQRAADAHAQRRAGGRVPPRAAPHPRRRDPAAAPRRAPGERARPRGGVLVLLGIAISNSWQLVLTHDGWLGRSVRQRKSRERRASARPSGQRLDALARAGWSRPGTARPPRAPSAPVTCARPCGSASTPPPGRSRW